MSKAQKLLERFLSKPSDFTFDELKRLLASRGYREEKTGKTSGSRISFINERSKHVIRLHKPHPRPVLKMYQIHQIMEELKDKGVL
ncbi:MAG: type II toxin-antitoxin system HicA family toxin [Nitrospinae bacterium]|nr:type II toxin-antitoxin system HicA family toxin [Nitrospinota bacterium]